MIGINPFDQPDVEASKIATRKLTTSTRRPARCRRRRRSSRTTASSSSPTSATRRARGAQLARRDTSRAHLGAARRGRLRRAARLRADERASTSARSPRCAARSATARASPPASASARASCTRPARPTRAARTPASSSRSPATTRTTCQVPGPALHLRRREGGAGARRLRGARRARPARAARAHLGADVAAGLAAISKTPVETHDSARRYGRNVMQLGMVGLGRMGANIVRRLMRGGHECVVYDVNPDAVDAARGGGRDRRELAGRASSRSCRKPRAVWVMVPAALTGRDRRRARRADGAGRHRSSTAATATTATTSSARRSSRQTGHPLRRRRHERRRVRARARLLPDDRRRARAGRAPRPDLPRRSRPASRARATHAGRDGEPSTAEHGYLHCGPAGAGHFVKMVHNGIEYGLMAAYAEGFNILRKANVGKRGRRPADAETDAAARPASTTATTSTSAAVAEVWRRGSVVASWLLDLTARALRKSPDLEDFQGRVSDSGEGRWTVLAAVDEGVPATCSRPRSTSASLARRRRVRQPPAVRDAQGVRRPRRARMSRR